MSQAYPTPERVKFTQHEQRLSWLALLLDAYLITDQGVREGIKREEKQGKNLACAKGCANCCRSHQTIPVYPLELMGMSWYAVEILEDELREKLKQQLRELGQIDCCPFLIDHACSIHPLRPLACRNFNVFGKQCAESEDAYYTRRQDVLTPIRKYTDQAFDIMLPFYGVKNKAERRKMIKTGSMHQMARVMRELNWENLAEKMDVFEDK
jgi:Fe-S-cluster containining protein